MSLASFVLTPRLPAIEAILARWRASRPQNDLEALLARMRQRHYPETIPVLASYWLKTVCAGGHGRGWWRELYGLLNQVLREQELTPLSRKALVGIRSWIRKEIMLTGEVRKAPPPPAPPFRPDLDSEQLAPYVVRLLNEWLIIEVAQLLTDEGEPAIPQDRGIPAHALGRALERLLVRERLSPEALEMLLQPQLLTPQHVYPRDAEILRDVVLALLGRTCASAPSVMPAQVLGLTNPASFLSIDDQAVRHASFLPCPEGDEIHIRIAPAQAARILQSGSVRIGSIVVTMDGRWWASEDLQSGCQHSVVYKPGGSLRIDDSKERTRLDLPWPETPLTWSGAVHFSDAVTIFGREWRVCSYDRDARRTWLHLTFSRPLPMNLMEPRAEVCFRRSHPAVVDMAWDSLKTALAVSLSLKTQDPIECLRCSELIPVGRALLALAKSVKSWRMSNRTLGNQLEAVREHQVVIASSYGRIPSAILPASVRRTLLRKGRRPVFRQLLNETFTQLPGTFGEEVTPGDLPVPRNQTACSSE
jgi:hypothetical protein